MRHDSIPHTPAPEAVTPPEPGPTSSDQLTLLRYRVTNFRSVKDSDWLDLGRITALVGVNESGKTNLLLPLWKLNPVADGLLDPVSDYPKAMFAEIRNAPDAYRFILAEFDTGQAADVIAERANIPVDAARRVAVGRLFDGSYTVDFPDYARPRQTDARRAAERLRSAHARIEAAETQPGEDELHASVLDGISAMLAEIEAEPVLTGNDMMRLRNRVSAMIPEEIRIVSATVAELRALRRDLGAWMTDMLAPDPGQIDTVRDAVLSRLPRFVYYSSWATSTRKSTCRMWSTTLAAAISGRRRHQRHARFGCCSASSGSNRPRSWSSAVISAKPATKRVGGLPGRRRNATRSKA